MAWIGFGDIVTAIKLVVISVRHPSSRAIYWSVRRRLSAERLRQQTRFVHLALAHKARDIVAERLECWAESERNVEAVVAAVDSQLACMNPPVPADPLINAISIEANTRYLVELVKDTGDSVDEFMKGACTALSNYLTEWMPGKCRTSIHVLLPASRVHQSPAFRRHSKSPEFVKDPSKLWQQIGGELKTDDDDSVVSCVRARCTDSSTRPQTWRLLEATTAFHMLMSAEWNSPHGDDELFQLQDISRESSKNTFVYRDPSPERRQYDSVVVVPIRGVVMGQKAVLGFVWLDAEPAYAFGNMFQHDCRPHRCTAGLHLLHAFADIVATVLACETNVSRGAKHSEERLHRAQARLKKAGNG